MMKFIEKKNKKIFAVFVVILITACSDPNAEVKELNTHQLNDVIDTLYIENNQIDDTAEIHAVNTTTTIISNAITQNTANSSSVDNIVISNDFSNVGAKSSTNLNNSEQETIKAIKDEGLSAENYFSAEDSSVPLGNDSNISSVPGFSKPTTQSETTSDIVMKKLLSQYPVIDYTNSPISTEEAQKTYTFCQAISDRLSSVSMKGCLAANHRISPFKTVNGKPIVVTEFAPKKERKPLGKILVIGGTHGDELTSVSTAYKWISNLNKAHSGLFHWHIAPAINADSILSRPAIRPNANGVDINRNLPTPDWNKQSSLRWEKLSKNSRKNPGISAASEPETQWIMHEIATFQPDAIVSIHAPYGILDFDSPKLNNAPANFGRLQLNLLGTYPGSLGHYAGIVRKIPVLTLELPNASSMPSQKDLAAIWRDMIKWLAVQLR